MLIDPVFTEDNLIVALLNAIAGNNDGNQEHKQLAPGIYEINHYNSESLLDRSQGWADGFNYQYPKLTTTDDDYFGSYGVCDNYQQVLDKCPMLSTSKREFVLFVTAVCKADQYEEGGWRWHKWGEYIGTQPATCEYLYDEPLIDMVYVYHITERKTI